MTRPTHLLFVILLIGTAAPLMAQAQESGDAVTPPITPDTAVETTAAPPADAPEPREQMDYIDRLTAEQERNIIDRAFPLNTAIWESPQIFVCWEEMDEVYADQRTLVQKAVTETWQAASALEFFGWKQCRENSSGVRIAVQDIGPHVKGLGKFVDSKPDGMVLNFVYDIWSPGCQAQIEHCTYTIAVHEFGHAIGFAHEQNRPDTPSDLCDQAQGTMGDDISLTPWDLESVMNYCNPLYGNGGKLSPLDVAAVQYIYGK